MIVLINIIGNLLEFVQGKGWELGEENDIPVKGGNTKSDDLKIYDRRLDMLR